MLNDLSTTRPARRPRGPLALAPVLFVAFTLAACAGAAGGPGASTGTASPTPGTASPKPTPTAVPGQGGATTDPGAGTADPGAGGGTDGNPGTGVLPPGITFPEVDVPDQTLLGDVTYLTPIKGLINQHNVNVALVRAGIGGDGHVYVDLRWWSGVAPCNQLDSVKVVRDDVAKTAHFTVVEGSAPGDQMCIELAELHATAVDLGVLEAGSWTISAEGEAPAITLDVG